MHAPRHDFERPYFTAVHVQCRFDEHRVPVPDAVPTSAEHGSTLRLDQRSGKYRHAHLALNTYILLQYFEE